MNTTDLAPHAGDHRPDVYFEGEMMVIRGSALGRNLCSLVRSGLGMPAEPPPAMMLEKYNEGNRAEPHILKAARDKGWPHFVSTEYRKQKSTGQIELEYPVGKNIIIRVHPDDVVTDGTTKRVLEAKALGKTTNYLTMPSYLWQMSVAMVATGLGGLWAIGWKTPLGPNDANDLGFTLDVELEEVDVPYFSATDIKRRALQIYRAVRDRDIPDCESRQWPCGYYTDPDALCGQKKAAPEYVDLNERDVAKIAALVTRWRMQKSRLDQLKKAVDETRGEIAGATVGLGVGRAALVDGTEIVWKEGKPGGIDWAKVPEELKSQVQDEKYRKPQGKPYIELREKRTDDQGTAE